MICSICKKGETSVVDSRPTEDGTAIRRRRLCVCGARFTTLERVQFRELMVVKKNGRKSAFDRDKLAKSIYIALKKRPIDTDTIEKFITKISRSLEELGQNELKLDLIDILSLPAFDITYEKIKDPYSSFGVSMFINAGDNDSASRNWTDKFSLTPFYRFYFFNKRDYGGAGFFAEVFTKFSSGKHDVEYYNFNPDPNSPGISYWETIEENFFDIAPGAAIGQKWVKNARALKKAGYIRK